ncbi:AsnC family transcriptional regulator [Candidatus Falkowbacteria bacterium CG10_big_fil_rev_8_21_14_0_10_44_15]|uniref:AsnC family transcriptional regulator n=1 Tax=Candidatus Falkowbacteria bacterium CG10_big_fil_rev_8_21_14_0_10_44_15 TaxID=1974569 RepID=A0A2H0UZ95_9BACT|nr:MAG: AsnC family transcriptional regulator [Candidatus Falkowbacteria bacterium CG10_big_fil_rev_8_21_14_0_10_44_15]
MFWCFNAFMFNLSTKSDYGFIVMLELAQKYQRGLVSLSDIARRRKLSSGYLVQIIQPLVKAKLIVSKEGKGGGYQLARNPKQISALAIIEALEGKTALVKCLKHGGKVCPGFGQCEARRIWEVMSGEVRGMLKKKTLAALIKEVILKYA